jgi:hypothetical protein
MDRALIPIILFQVIGVVALAFSPIGQALAKRIGGTRVEPGELDELRGEIAELRSELDDVRARAEQVGELQERVDFAERLLAQARAQGALPGSDPR